MANNQMLAQILDSHSLGKRRCSVGVQYAVELFNAVLFVVNWQTDQREVSLQYFKVFFID